MTIYPAQNLLQIMGFRAAAGRTGDHHHTDAEGAGRRDFGVFTGGRIT